MTQSDKSDSRWWMYLCSEVTFRPGVDYGRSLELRDQLEAWLQEQPDVEYVQLDAPKIWDSR